MQLSAKLALLSIGAVTATLFAVFFLLSRELSGAEIALPANLVHSQHQNVIDRISADQRQARQLADTIARMGLVFGSPVPEAQYKRVSSAASDGSVAAVFSYDRGTGEILPISTLNPVEADDLVEASSMIVRAIKSRQPRDASGFLTTSTNLFFMGSANVKSSQITIAVLYQVDLAAGPGPVGLLAKVEFIKPVAGLGTDYASILSKLRTSDSIEAVQLLDSYDTFSLLESATGEQLLIRVNVPRYGLLIATEGLRRFIPLTVLCGFFIALAFGLWHILVVARPLKTILHYGDSTLEPNHRDVAEQMKRRDDFGGLARLVRRLRDTMIRAEETSRRHGYRTGMEEMASAILHNVGNTLTPVVVGVDRILDRLRQDRGADIGIAAKEISDPETPAERREKLVQYFGLMQEQFADRQTELSDDLSKISAQVVRIEEMLSSGELLGNDMEVIETLEMESVVRAAISAVPMKLQGIANVEVDESLAVSEPVVGSKLELIQVVLNILCNASESIEKRGNRDGHIKISAEQTSEDGNQLLHLSFKDNGMGVRREQMPFIFEKGFSTKQGRRGGNGLDWCARTIAKLNGRIYAESDGAGRGVTFHLVLPLNADAGTDRSANDVGLKVVA